eukprot:6481291-Amphidinium_carterae.2
MKARYEAASESQGLAGPMALVILAKSCSLSYAHIDAPPSHIARWEPQTDKIGLKRLRSQSDNVKRGVEQQCCRVVQMLGGWRNSATTAPGCSTVGSGWAGDCVPDVVMARQKILKSDTETRNPLRTKIFTNHVLIMSFTSLVLLAHQPSCVALPHFQFSSGAV